MSEERTKQMLGVLERIGKIAADALDRMEPDEETATELALAEALRPVHGTFEKYLMRGRAKDIAKELMECENPSDSHPSPSGRMVRAMVKYFGENFDIDEPERSQWERAFRIASKKEPPADEKK